MLRPVISILTSIKARRKYRLLAHHFFLGETSQNGADRIRVSSNRGRYQGKY